MQLASLYLQIQTLLIGHQGESSSNGFLFYRLPILPASYSTTTNYSPKMTTVRGKLTFKDSALKIDKLNRSCQRVLSHTILTRDFMNV